MSEANIRKDIQELTKMVTNRFDNIDNRLDNIDARLNSQDKRLDKIDNRFDNIDACSRTNAGDQVNYALDSNYVICFIMNLHC